MPSSVHILEIATESKEQFVDLTAKVKSLVQKSGVPNGIVHVYCPHTTAAIVVQENTDAALRKDILEALDRAVPPGLKYGHNEPNAPAHIRAALLGSSTMVNLDAGKLLLGAWQAIYLLELDGPRRRTVQVKILAG